MCLKRPCSRVLSLYFGYKMGLLVPSLLGDGVYQLSDTGSQVGTVSYLDDSNHCCLWDDIHLLDPSELTF